jgi:hypothetical protein
MSLAGQRGIRSSIFLDLEAYLEAYNVAQPSIILISELSLI